MTGRTRSAHILRTQWLSKRRAQSDSSYATVCYRQYYYDAYNVQGI